MLPEAMLISIGQTAIGDIILVPVAHALEPMLMSIACTSTRDHAEVDDMC